MPVITLFLTFPHAYVYDLARGLRRGGGCGTECLYAYNIDGGPSTQMGAAADDGFRSLELTSAEPEPLDTCHAAVDHYLVITSPARPAGQRTPAPR
jgi:hypothetical protein